MKKKIPLSFARLLKQTLESEVAAASFTNKKLLDQFLQDGALDFRLIGNQQKKIFTPNSANLQQYLHNKFEIPSLDEYIRFLEKEDIERSDAARAVSNTKFRKTTVFTGFLLNCYDELHCSLHNKPFTVKPVTGAFTFIAAYKHFTIPDDVTVIVVEGHENFREISRQRYLFEGVKPLFVWRYQNSTAMADWLSMIPNPFIHFGDFDPKGLHIYASEFKSKLPGRGRFLIPPGLENLLIAHGERDLFEQQKKFIPTIEVLNDAELMPLIRMIQQHKKGLAQEILIEALGHRQPGK